MEENEGIDRGPDTGKLRRFALGVATVLIVLVLAGGTLRDEVQGPLIGVVKFERPGILLFLLALLSVYASVRYAYYGIVAPVTRSRIQNHLRNDWSLLCVKTTRSFYEDGLVRRTEPFSGEHVRMETLCLPGLTPWHFIVFTDHNIKPEPEFVKHVLANRIDSYFPGITSNEITLATWYDHHVRAKVGPLKSSTQLRLRLEQFDVYLPLIANGFAWLLLLWWALPVMKWLTGAL